MWGAVGGGLFDLLLHFSAPLLVCFHTAVPLLLFFPPQLIRASAPA